MFNQAKADKLFETNLLKYKVYMESVIVELMKVNTPIVAGNYNPATCSHEPLRKVTDSLHRCGKCYTLFTLKATA